MQKSLLLSNRWPSYIVRVVVYRDGRTQEQDLDKGTHVFKWRKKAFQKKARVDGWIGLS